MYDLIYKLVNVVLVYLIKVLDSLFAGLYFLHNACPAHDKSIIYHFEPSANGIFLNSFMVLYDLSSVEVKHPSTVWQETHAYGCKFDQRVRVVVLFKQ
jgi:hypothetical protein